MCCVVWALKLQPVRDAAKGQSQRPADGSFIGLSSILSGRGLLPQKEFNLVGLRRTFLYVNLNPLHTDCQQVKACCGGSTMMLQSPTSASAITSRLQQTPGDFATPDSSVSLPIAVLGKPEKNKPFSQTLRPSLATALGQRWKGSKNVKCFPTTTTCRCRPRHKCLVTSQPQRGELDRAGRVLDGRLACARSSAKRGRFLLRAIKTSTMHILCAYTVYKYIIFSCSCIDLIYFGVSLMIHVVIP